MVGYLARPKSIGERFASAFAGAGEGLASGFGDLMKERETKAKLLQKSKEAALKDVPQYLKNWAPDIEKVASRKDKFLQHYSDLLDKGFPKDQAFQEATKLIRSEMLSGDTERQPIGKSSFGISIPEQKDDPYGLFSGPTFNGQFAPQIQEIKKAVSQRPDILAKEIPVAATKSIENLIQSLGGGMEDPVQKYFEKIGYKKPKDTLTSIVSERARQGLTPEQKQGAETYSDIGSILLDFIMGGGRGKTPKTIRGFNKSISETPLAGEAKAAKIAPEALKETKKGEGKVLEGRVSKEAPEEATQMRMERAGAKKKLYPTFENEKIRNEQLKRHPQYIVEIEADAAKRAAQAEAREPKTVKGMDSRKIRIHEAEKRLPEVKEGYYKAAARMRALEDEYARLPSEMRKEMQPLLKMAENELKEAEFALKQATENLKGISYRGTVQEFKDAARKKILDIENAVSEGEEYKLAKMDYSPDLIKEAKRISKRKPIPTTRKPDFYNQVHEHYKQEYKDRMGKLVQESRELAKDKSMKSLARRQQIKKEMDILGKMIESAEAEQTIHNHKFGLREMAERQKAKERIGKFKQIQESPKVKKVASEKMWKERIEEAKTPQERTRLAEEVVQEAEKEAPKVAKTIEKQKGDVIEALDDLAKKSKKVEKGIKETPKDKASWKTFVPQFAKDFKELIDAFMPPSLAIFKTRIGRDFASALGSQVIGEVSSALEDSYDIELPATVRNAVLASWMGGRRGSAYRILFSSAMTGARQHYQKEQYKQAVLKGDRKKMEEFEESYSKSVIKKANKDLMSA